MSVFEALQVASLEGQVWVKYNIQLHVDIYGMLVASSSGPFKIKQLSIFFFRSPISIVVSYWTKYHPIPSVHSLY